MNELMYQFAALSNFHFMRPQWLLALVPFVLVYRSMSQRDDLLVKWKSVMSPPMVEHLTLNPHGQRVITPKKVFLLFSVIATLVMAGPTWKQQDSPLFEDNSELIVALDVSIKGSDLAPSRLVRAKQKISQLLELRGDAKSGLIIFGGSAHVAMPVTKDKALASYFLDALQPSLLPDTNYQSAAVLKPIEQLLAQSKAPSTVLIVTDKTDQQAIDAFSSAFEQQQHQVVVWAIGDIETKAGIVERELDELRQLAQAGNGSLVTFSFDDSDVNSVNRMIDNNLFAVKDNDQPWYDSGYWLLFMLLPVQLMWFRRGWTLQW